MATIGKNVLENLTTAMYEDLRIIYREYIQNSADSIDKAVKEGLIEKSEAIIDVKIDANNRIITITDNGKGIPSRDFKHIMDSIAESSKVRGEDKGFRGIGRLGGISSCDKLIFRTSYAGEKVVSVCTWDAKEVRRVIADNTDKTNASDLVDKVTAYSTEPIDEERHFFEVELVDVVSSSSELLDADNIKSYLRFVAPVPYKSSFIFRTKIKDFANENGFKIDEYLVYVNNDRLFKPYVTNIYKPGSNGEKNLSDEIKDVKFEVFKDSKGNVLAWMWFGISGFELQINDINEMIGIRLRKENIQIGDEKTFGTHDFYSETRGWKYFVGEVFAVHPNLIPNARRDYFNLNETCREFESTLRDLFYNRFKKIYSYANDYKKAVQSEQALIDAERDYAEKTKKGSFIDEKDKKKAEENLEAKRTAADRAKRTIETRKTKEGQDDVLSKVYGILDDKYKPETQNNNNRRNEVKVEPEQKKKIYLPQQLSKYSKKEQKLIGNIYSIINMALAHDSAEQLILKIQEELMK